MAYNAAVSLMNALLPAQPKIAAPPAAPPAPPLLPPAVIALSLVSLLTDLGTAMIVPLRLVFLVGVLHISLPLAGLVEGVAAGAAPLLRLLAGRLPVRWRAGWVGIALGYGLSNVARPLLGLVGAAWPMVGLTLLDRAGRGLRAGPRDQLLATLTPPAGQPRAFAFHRVLTTVGALVGPICAAWVLGNTPANLQTVFLWTALPGVLALVALAVAFNPRRPTPADRPFEEPLPPAAARLAAPPPVATSVLTARARRAAAGAPISPAPTPAPSAPAGPTSSLAHRLQSAVRNPQSALPSALFRALGMRFWLATTVATVFALGQVSIAFPLFYSLGLVKSLALIPWLYFAALVVYSVLVAPASGWAERRGPQAALLAAGALFALIQMGWGFAQQGWQVWALFLLYGVFLALQDGQGRALALTDLPVSLRAPAAAWFDGLTAGATILASVAGGWLWREYGAAALFGWAAWLGSITVSLLIAWGRWLRPMER